MPRSRRHTLAAFGGALAGGSVLDRAIDARSETDSAPAPIASKPDSYAVEVSIFTVDRLWRAPPGRDAGPRYRARLARAALEHAVPTLSDEHLDVEADVRVVGEPVPDDAVERGDAHAILSAFDTYLDERAPVDAVATDSNLLIAQAPDAGSAGLAQQPDEEAVRGSDANVAAVFDGLGLGQNELDAATSRRHGAYGRTLSTAVHEVGHNVGLDHDDGRVRRDADDPSRLFVTPMRTGYVDAEVRPIYAPGFNPAIDPRSLVLG